MKRAAGWLGGALAAALAIGLGACANLPAEQFHTLGSDAAAIDGAATAPLIEVGPVILPDLADRPQLVLTLAGNHARILEQQRWAAPLDSEIARVLGQNLRPRIGALRQSPSTPGRPALSTATPLHVKLTFLRFESRAVRQVAIDVLWQVTAKDGATLAGGQANLVEDVVTADSRSAYDGVVAAYGRALSRLATGIAASLASPLPAEAKTRQIGG
jgi:uncharacterized lipoprotein YmbA